MFHMMKQLECPDLKFSGHEKLGRTEYFGHLRNAKFCLAPRGESSWTLRFYESFFVVHLFLSMSTVLVIMCSCPSPLNKTLFLPKQECVPVILSDQAEFPFQNVIDYRKISIKWPSTSIGPELLEYLESIPGGVSLIFIVPNFIFIVFFFQAVKCGCFCGTQITISRL